MGRALFPSILVDWLFLTAIVAITATPYIGGLGFYSDDLYFLGLMHQGPDQTVMGYLTLLLNEEGVRPRPVQALLWAVLFDLFGFSPLAHHLVNHAVLIAAILVLYSAQRRLGVPRVYALAIMVVFASLPDYSTARFWFSAYQCALALMFFAAAFYGSVRYAEAPHLRRWPWLAMAAVAMALCVFSYEIFFLLFILIPLPIYLRDLAGPSPKRPSVSLKDARFRCFAVQMVTFGVLTVVLYAAKMNLYAGNRIWHGDIHARLLATANLLRGTVSMIAWHNGVLLPANVVKLARADWQPQVAVSALVCLVLTGVHLGVLTFRGSRPTVRAGMLAIILGGLILAAGVAVFAASYQIGFSPTGMSNRVAVAFALGAATIFVGVVMVLQAWLPGLIAKVFVPAAVAMVCAAGVFINSGLGVYWIQAAAERQAIVDGLKTALPNPSAGVSLLLAGFCPYNGPAPVLESFWAVTGALQLAYDDPSIVGDGVRPSLRIAPEGIVNSIFNGSSVLKYDKLMVYDHRSRRLFALGSPAGADRFFHDFPAATLVGCKFRDGEGTKIY